MPLFWRRALASAAVVMFSGFASAQVTVTPIGGAVTANSMASMLLGAGSGITITNATYTGAPGASGTFTATAGILGVTSGIVLTSGSVNSAVGPNNAPGFGPDNSLPGDADLNTLTTGATQDASVLTITFVPTGTSIQFSYVFGSEEYNEFVGSEFNVNRALIPGTSTPVAINNVNCGNSATGVPPPGPGVNCSLYINNDPPSRNTQLDGLTQIFTLTATVTPNVPNTLKIAIADTSDGILDSAVFIAAGSLAVCGGPGQPPCGALAVPAAPVPTLSEWALLLLALLAGITGLQALRRRR
jgi:exosortase sorting signal-containing protein